MDDNGGNGALLTVLIGNNLGRTTWVSQVPIGRLVRSASICKELGGSTTSQEAVDHVARQILFGLVNGARAQRIEQGIAIHSEFDRVLSFLHVTLPRTVRPVLAHIREVVPENTAVRAERIFWHTRETLGFRVYIPPEYPWRLMSGHADLEACGLALEICDAIIRTNRYPDKGYFPRMKELSPNELTVWREALAGSHSFTKLAAEFYIGMSPEEEREVFLGLSQADLCRRRVRAVKAGS